MARIYEIKKQLADVEPGGVFYLPGYAGRRYLKTGQSLHQGQATVVDVQNGNMANFYEALTVVEMENTL